MQQHLLELKWLEAGDVLVVTKLNPGFDDRCVDDLTRLCPHIFGRMRTPNIWYSISRIDIGVMPAPPPVSRIWSPQIPRLS